MKIISISLIQEWIAVNPPKGSSWLNRNVLMLAIQKCPLQWIKLSVWVFLGNLTFILFLSIMLHEKAEKRSSKDCLQPLNVHNLRIPSPCPLPAPMQAFFPSPASVSQVKSETSRWGGESKGWGLRLCLEIVIN